MNSKNSVIMYIGQGNITSIFLPLIKAIKNRKLNQFSILQQIYLFCLLTVMSSIYSSLLFLMDFLGKIYCPTCEMKDFGKNGTYERDEDLPLLPITIEWKVQRYYCKTCPSTSFSSFTNTLFHNKEKHPAFFLVSCIFQILPYNSKLSTFLQQIQRNIIRGTEEPTFSIDMEQNHQPDDFVQDIRYFSQECLDEKQRRLLAGVLSKLFNNITATHQITGMARKTVRRGRNEISDRLKLNHIDQPIRRTGAREYLEKYLFFLAAI